MHPDYNLYNIFGNNRVFELFEHFFQNGTNKVKFTCIHERNTFFFLVPFTKFYLIKQTSSQNFTSQKSIPQKRTLQILLSFIIIIC